MIQKQPVLTILKNLFAVPIAKPSSSSPHTHLVPPVQYRLFQKYATGDSCHKRNVRRSCLSIALKRVLMQRQCGATYVNRNEAFPALICLDAIKFVLLSFFSLINTICLGIGAQPQPKNGKNPPLTFVAQKRLCFSTVDTLQNLH